MLAQWFHGFRRTINLACSIGGTFALLSACSSDVVYDSGKTPPGQVYENCQQYLRQFDLDYRPVADRSTGACRIRDAVQVSRIGQAKLSRPAIMTCALAVQLSEFETVVLQPAAKRTLGSPITTIHHYGTYACRNARSKSRLSQHAYANAIDIGIFETASGIKTSVSRHWDEAGSKGEFLKTVGQGACTLFHGVLGPDSDRNHQDHFHFDMGPYTYCQLRPIDPRRP